MDVEKIKKKYVGKKCRIVLKNNYNYTAVIPEFNGDSFTINDKFGDSVEIDCDFIAIIQVIGGESQ